MLLVSLQQLSQSITTGTQSDGSDRQTTVHQYWEAVVFDDLGQQHTIDFPLDGPQPTNQQIIDQIPKPTPLVPSSKADLAIYMKALRDDWMGWRQVRLEAQSRPAAASAVFPLIVQENTAWNLLLQAITAWMAAS